jgi:hypothetical protein
LIVTRSQLPRISEWAGDAAWAPKAQVALQP